LHSDENSIIKIGFQRKMPIAIMGIAAIGIDILTASLCTVIVGVSSNIQGYYQIRLSAG
jgi:hypothetical protein